MSERYITSEVVHKHHTDDAVLIAFDNEEAWVPRSCLSWTCDREIDNLRRGQEFEIKVAEWLAMKIGLV